MLNELLRELAIIFGVFFLTALVVCGRFPTEGVRLVVVIVTFGCLITLF